MSLDGSFFDLDGKPFELTWANMEACSKGKETSRSDQYRLEKITKLPGIYSLRDLQDVYLGQDALGPVSIVVTERSGGVRHFAWWLKMQNEKKWYFTQSIDAAWQLAKNWSSSGSSKDIWVVLDRSKENSLSEDDRIKLGGLAMHFDGKEWRESGSKFACITLKIDELKQDVMFSNIVDNGHVYRLPSFNLKELCVWSEILLRKQTPNLKANSASVIPLIARSALHWIGGQPTLTHFFFNLLEEDLSKGNGVTTASRPKWKDYCDRVGGFIRRQTPGITKNWGNELSILLKDPQIRRRLESYIQGETIASQSISLTKEDEVLYMAGWIGRNAEEKWSIRSECHKHWAKTVLRGAAL